MDTIILILTEGGGILLLFFLILVGYFVGSLNEKKHYRSIEQREKEYIVLPAVSMKNTDWKDEQIAQAELVIGSVVLSNDHFKRFLASFRNIFGGRVKSYETLLDRARREAVLRMKEASQGASIIVNVRLETSTIGNSANRKGYVGSIEVVAYGTAITKK